MKHAKHAKHLAHFSAAAFALATMSASAATSPVLINQGAKWTTLTRQAFYTQDQGSRLMPLKWLQALTQSNGDAFMANNLSRYGYLPNPKTPTIPIGFSVASEKNGDKTIGMTCSACHTRDIEVSGKTYRIDGGPAFSDFQSFMIDLDKAVNTVLTDTTAFDEFADKVLGTQHLPPAHDALYAAVQQWFLPYHTLVKNALPTESPWGVGRLDAVSMIFNRLTGLDIGKPPSYIIKENIKVADAAVRYPFLWNAPKQDYTQWAGFSPNGNRLLGLSRNLGEVIGVFGVLHPKKDATNPLKINYVAENSANFAGLNRQEDWVLKIGAPKWPWKLNKTLVSAGEKVFNQQDPNEENKSCADCHAIKDGESRSFATATWATPIVDVGTDSREIGLLGSEVKTGVLENTQVSPNGEPLKAVDKAIKVLSNAVLGSIIQHYVPSLLTTPEQIDINALLTGELGTAVKSIDKKNWGSFGTLTDLLPTQKTDTSTTTSTTPSYAYEARVLNGIWAVAPYLHNGSVPTLAELLKPAADRVAEFKIGAAYDIVGVGLAVNQPKLNSTLKTTDCNDRNSGNSRCGHEYGTQFTDAEKTALLEYLKSL